MPLNLVMPMESVDASGVDGVGEVGRDREAGGVSVLYFLFTRAKL